MKKQEQMMRELDSARKAFSKEVEVTIKITMLNLETLRRRYQRSIRESADSAVRLAYSNYLRDGVELTNEKVICLAILEAKGLELRDIKKKYKIKALKVKISQPKGYSSPVARKAR